ncbi:MAG TPA: ATP-dependent protease ATPase subunit HslU [Candidatus Hydrogenedentes bacterium]|jgi:ATP-dependent HslUV protease ATP-binding subunit HslU|nr:ATP-dependent protease ATPase subunit HslU [Candidatus Hydrogenedentota bacterium]
MMSLTPREIVAELDKYIIGQDAAKRKVAIALRNRWRRQQLDDALREEVAPKNIILIGPTGVGKTEIARRLAKLADAPFIKVEASKFTEVGYVGRDCESMIRELTEVAVHMVREEMVEAIRPKAAASAEWRLLDILLPPRPSAARQVYRPGDLGAGDEAPAAAPAEPDAEARTREILLAKLRAGDLDEREIDVEVRETGSPQTMQVFSNAGLEEMGFNIQEMFERFMPQRTKRRRVTVAEAREILEQEEAQNLLDMDAVVREAIHRTENAGIVFLDEIDKIAGHGAPRSGPDISREGVQRDILPIVEGSTVTTKSGPVKTDHILFIAAGAFHMSKVSDLIPELQGRFPIRVELNSLRLDDFKRILREPENSLIRQYQALLATEGVTVEFDDDCIDLLASVCEKVNASSENIGARRLHTILEYLLEDLLFDATEKKGMHVRMSAEDAQNRLAEIAEDRDLTKYIL